MSSLLKGDLMVADKQVEKEPEADDEAPGRRLDPELRTLGAIIRLLENQEPDAKARAVVYLLSRYGAKP